jgi:hypothetical protein
MAIIYIPVLAREKYETLRGILGSKIPDAFDDWEQFLTDKAAKARAGLDTVRNVNVDPDEFARYLDTTHSQHDLDALDDFTAEKASGKSY